MNLTLRQLRYVCEVARLGTVLAASKSLLISQSSILAAISAAEAEIGGRIFERYPAKGVRITEVLSFVSAARTLLAADVEFTRLVDGIGDRVPPVLRVGCFEPLGSLFMPNMMRLYTDRFGNVEIDLFEGIRIEPATLGDPVRPLIWVSKSMEKLAAVLTEMGHPISTDTMRTAAHLFQDAILRDGALRRRDRVRLIDPALRPIS